MVDNAHHSSSLCHRRGIHPGIALDLLKTQLVMAQSKTGGVYGMLRKSVGSVTYSVSTASISGVRKQIARMKPTQVRNPKTLAQIVQRMKTGPAQLFYAAFEKAAGSVENNPLSHSWQGIQYGAKSRLRFLQLAMQGDPKAYVPKGINSPVPGVYQVSEGSLPSLPSAVADGQGDLALTVGAPLTSGNVEMLQSLGVEVGDQITVLAIIDADNGSYKASFARVVVGAGNGWESTNDSNNDLEDLRLYDDGIKMTDSNIACAAFILSRGVSTSSAKRSTAVMTMNPEYADLLSPEAYDAAVNSWMEGVTYNSLNSDWYLNQGTTQAFNGEVFSQILTLAAGSGVDEESARFILGRQSNGGSIVYTIFTSDGTNAGTVYAVRPNGPATDVAWTAARVATALGDVNIQYAQYTSAIYSQLSGNV